VIGRTAAIVAGTLLAVCCAGAGISLLSKASDPARGTPAPAGAPLSPDRPGLGDAVRDGVFEFTVLSFSCGHTSVDTGWLHAEPQGQFCLAELRVTNVDTRPQRFADGNQRAFGPDRRQYAADTGTGVVANGNGNAIWNVVNPGNSLTAKVVYDIPAAASIDTLELHDSPFSRGVAVGVTTA
jgi:hypothetical protein